jgi:hypothetical protein
MESESHEIHWWAWRDISPKCLHDLLIPWCEDEIRASGYVMGKADNQLVDVVA